LEKVINIHGSEEKPADFWRRKRRVLFIIIFTLLHMFLTGLLFMASFSVVLANANDDKPLPLAGKALVMVSEIFQWPLMIPIGRIEFLRDVLPNFSLYIILLLNSLIWALVALGILIRLRRL